MSFFSHIGHEIEKHVLRPVLSKNPLGHEIEKHVLRPVLSKIPHTTSSEKRAQMEAAKEQIDYYQKAKEDLINARTESENEKKLERQKIGEREIRNRKSTYRRGGFMETPGTALKETLG